MEGNVVPIKQACKIYPFNQNKERIKNRITIGEQTLPYPKTALLPSSIRAQLRYILGLSSLRELKNNLLTPPRLTYKRQNVKELLDKLVRLSTNFQKTQKQKEVGIAIAILLDGLTDEISTIWKRNDVEFIKKLNAMTYTSFYFTTLARALKDGEEDNLLYIFNDYNNALFNILTTGFLENISRKNNEDFYSLIEFSHFAFSLLMALDEGKGFSSLINDDEKSVFKFHPSPIYEQLEEEMVQRYIEVDKKYMAYGSSFEKVFLLLAISGEKMGVHKSAIARFKEVLGRVIRDNEKLGDAIKAILLGDVKKRLKFQKIELRAEYIKDIVKRNKQKMEGQINWIRRNVMEKTEKKEKESDK